MVIFQSRRNHEAPSIAAASYSDGSIVDIAESTTTMPKPKDVQTSARMTTMRAVQGLDSQGKLDRPSGARAWSTSPEGRKKVLNSAPTITGDRTQGMKNRNRNTRQPRTFSYTRTATTTEAARISGTEIRKISELTKTCSVTGFEKISR